MPPTRNPSGTSVKTAAARPTRTFACPMTSRTVAPSRVTVSRHRGTGARRGSSLPCGHGVLDGDQLYQSFPAAQAPPEVTGERGLPGPNLGCRQVTHEVESILHCITAEEGGHVPGISGGLPEGQLVGGPHDCPAIRAVRNVFLGCLAIAGRRGLGTGGPRTEQDGDDVLVFHGCTQWDAGGYRDVSSRFTRGPRRPGGGPS